tara:strand:+ start:1800 stop:2360 length:561 start_codon:yes stop_codon:yes gene_type:complete
MPNYQPASPSGNTTKITTFPMLSGATGVLAEVIKKDGKFRVIKTNKPPLSATISLTAVPAGSKGVVTQWTLDYIDAETTTSNSLDRSGTPLPALNPVIYIHDTDIISLFVKPKTFSDAGDVATLVLTADASSYPYSGIQSGSIVNNPEDSGVIKWNPGVGNTGNFFYRWNGDASAVGGTINVTPTP